jgi:putative MATE family efflux protein
MQDLTSGSVTRHLLKTTGFMLVTMIFQTLYFLSDLYWVGRLGKEAVAGVAVAGNLTFIVLAATQMLSVGTTTLISHAAGRKEQEGAITVFNQSLMLGAVCGLGFLLFGTLLSGWYARQLAADPVTAGLARYYMGWFIPAMALQFPMVSMSAALRGTGNFKPGMVVQTATVIVNIIVTPMLMFGWPAGPALGVSGAALGTFISLLIGTIWLALYFRGTTAYLHFRPATWRPQLSLWSRMLKVGLPAGAEFGLMAVYLLIVYIVIRPFGAAAQAGFGIGLRIVQALFLPQVALGIAVAPVAGQNFGAGHGERVRQTFRSAAAIGGGIAMVAVAICLASPAAFIRVFASDAQVIAVGSEYLRIAAVSFVASAEIFVASSMFQAMGNTIPPLIASAGRLLIVGVAAVAMSRMPSFQLVWVWYLSVTAIWLQLAANLLLLRREFSRRLA